MKKYGIFTVPVSFSALAIGEIFQFNGNEYAKKSNRTAELLEYNKRFYFGKNDLCRRG
jgi:hypothetical protein